ncbi:MAG: NAD-glutamate dehydrogenase domain-containing protein, partial [Chlamydiales bacterium]
MGKNMNPQDQLKDALQKESKKFEEFYLWLYSHMPPRFFEEVKGDNLLLITHHLMGLDLQEFTSHVHVKGEAFSLCLDTPEADQEILKHYRHFGIKDYSAFVSNAPPPFHGITSPLRIALLNFTCMTENSRERLSSTWRRKILELVQNRNPDVTDIELKTLMDGMNMRLLRALGEERLNMALEMFLRARTRDQCQYAVRHIEGWEQKKETPSLQIVLAWKNVHKHDFLFRLAQMIQRHGLVLKHVNATYIDPYSKENILILSMGLHGRHGKAAWEEADIHDFLQEMVTLKYFVGLEEIEAQFVDTKLVRGNIGNLLKALTYFVHQVLLQEDLHMYSFGQIVEGLCRHPELTVQVTQAFEAKFHPEKKNLSEWQKIEKDFLKSVEELDTGHEINDRRRKNILKQAINFVAFTLKTNFYRNNKIALSFRLDPKFLDCAPYKREEKFPELPYAIFFIKGMHFFGFHIRFKDLSRGGLRTVLPQKREQMIAERNNIFSECYGLAYTQQKKNKDIPEGGAKGVIFLEPYEELEIEEKIFKRELEEEELDPEDIRTRLNAFHKKHKFEYLYQSQRAYIESFMTLINCEPDGKLKAKDIVDYWQKPEYIYLGPDENIDNQMIVWIANFSKAAGYKPGGSFITSKPGAGINHKEYGVTSLGVNVYMEELLSYLKIDPAHQSFTLKMSGGPDGDVAGNQLLNLANLYPTTAKLLALTDVSGTIFDPQGLDLKVLEHLFADVKPIRFYPPEKLSEGGFLLDMRTKREQTTYAQQTLLWRKKEGKLIEEWLSGNEMNHLFRTNVHQTKADIFIPAGGRPRTLNDTNFKEFLDETGKSTSKAIVEGANLYLTPVARRSLEKEGVLIIKDSSANKGGVICSSFEVLCGLCLSEEEFIQEKPILMREILGIIRSRALDEAKLLLRTHAETRAFLTDISEWISEKINTFTYQLLDYFQPLPLSNDPKDPLIHCFLNYAPPLLRTRYQQRLLTEVPDIHK